MDLEQHTMTRTAVDSDALLNLQYTTTHTVVDSDALLNLQHTTTHTAVDSDELPNLQYKTTHTAVDSDALPNVQHTMMLFLHRQLAAQHKTLLQRFFTFCSLVGGQQLFGEI
jgi:hypothetical protein